MRTKTYVFEDIKKGMELIKEKYGPEALIVDIKNLGSNGSSRCEISILVDDDKVEGLSSTDLIRRKTEEIWESVYGVVSERFSEVEKYFFFKRIEAYPLSLRIIFDKMKKNHIDEKIAFEIVSEVYVEAGDLIDSMTKAYYFTKNAIKKKLRLYDLKSDTTPLVLFGPKGAGKSLTAKKIAQHLGNSGILTSIVYFGGSGNKPYPDISQMAIEGNGRFLIAEREEDVFEKIMNSRGRKVIVDFGGSECEEFLLKMDRFTESLLVLSAGTRDEKIVTYCERFRRITSGVVFTKLDEEVSCGHILNHALKLRMPLFMLGTGPNLKDIVSHEQERFFKILIEGNVWMGKDEKRFQ
ncbi:MAG: hypothetical protein N2513_01705 [Deltaproteobacteria bacterium]|nr:hypothetical protein [Deltaproteobacteria bacterium]